MKELSAIVQRLTTPNQTGGVLATLVSVKGSSYRRPGARLLVSADGTSVGSISGGCLEEDVLLRSRAVASTGRAELVTYDTTSENDLVWGVGLGCHGVVQVLLEKLSPSPAWAGVLAANLSARRPTELATVWGGVGTPGQSTGRVPLGTCLTAELPSLPADQGVFRQIVPPPTPLVIFGAGDDARPLVRLTKELGWHVTVADPRPAFGTVARFPEADAVIVAPAAELADRVALPPGALAVVMTHHYVHDVPLLRALLPRPLAYLGLLGPRQRADRILDDLTRDGLTLPAEMRSRLHAPVGLDLGTETPAEVALSILAEMQAVISGRSARSLRERTRPIHE